MYPHVPEQNLGHHMKFLQTTEYELFDFSGLIFPLQTSQPRGSNQESAFLRAGHLFIGTLCRAEAPRHGWQTSFHSDKHLQTTWFGRKSYATRRARLSAQRTLWPAHLLCAHCSAPIPFPLLPLPMAQRMLPGHASVEWGTSAAHPTHPKSRRCPGDAGMGMLVARCLLPAPSRRTRSQ